MLQIDRTFGEQNASKCAVKIEGKHSKTRISYWKQICAYAKCATHLEQFLPPNVQHIWNAFRRTEFFKTVIFLTRQMTVPGCKLHGNPIFKPVRATLACRTSMLQIVSTFGAENASKCAFKMEGKSSNPHMSYRTQLCAYANCATHLEHFLPPNV